MAASSTGAGRSAVLPIRTGAPVCGRLEHGLHHFQGVECQDSSCPRLLSGRGADEVRDAEAAPRVRVAGGDRKGLPVLRTEGEELHVAVEVVGIRDHEGTVLAVDFDVGALGLHGVEAHHQRGQGPRGMDQDAGDVGIDRHRHALAFARARADGPFIAGVAGRADHRDHRSEQRDQGRDVVRSHVQQRPSAGLVVEVRVRVPALVPGRDHGGGRGDGPADQPVVDRLPGGLDPGAEHGVRGAADRDAGRPRSVQHLPGLRRRCREGLLAVDGFAGGNRAQGDLGVGCGDGQVQDEFDVVGGQERVDRERPDAVVRVGHCLGPGGVQVRDGDEVDVLLEVGGSSPGTGR